MHDLSARTKFPRCMFAIAAIDNVEIVAENTHRHKESSFALHFSSIDKLIM